MRPAGFLLRCLAICVPLVLLGFGLLYLKLLNGPVSVSFLAGPMTRALNAELPGLAVGVQNAVLQLSQRGGLEVRLQTVRLTDRSDTLVALASGAIVEMNPRALWSGRIAAARVALVEPRVLLAYDDRGKLVFTGREPEAVPEPAPVPQASPADAPTETSISPTAAPAAPSQVDAILRIDVARTVAEAIARLRQSGDAASYLEAIGLRDATVIIEDRGRKDVWKVAELDLDLAHRQKRSTVTLEAKIVSGGRPWTLSLKADEAAKARTIALEAKFADLVPRNIFRDLRGYPALEGIDVPLSGTAYLDIDADGDVQQGRLDVAVGAGNLYFAGLDGVPLGLDGGTLALRFDEATRRIELARSTLRSGDSRVALTGLLVPSDSRSTGSGHGAWTFEVKALEGQLAAPDGGAAIPIERLAANGTLGPAPGRITMTELTLKAGPAELTMAGEIGQEAMLEGRVSPMPVTALKALWPMGLAPRARTFAVERIGKGNLKGGAFKITSERVADPTVRRPAERRLALTLEAADVEVELRKGLPPLEIPRVLLRVEGNSLELSMPDAQMTASPNRRVVVKGGRITVVEIDQPKPIAEIAARAQGPLSAVLDLLDREPLSLLKGQNIQISQVDGKVDVQMRATLPLDEASTLADLRFEGKARVTDGRVKDIVGTHDINGASFIIDATEKAIDLKGELLLAGVLAKLNGQWYPGSTDGKQPPLRITARLDNADRNHLGLDLDDIIQGEVPLELTVQRGRADEIALHVTGDLTAAELMLDEVHWRKPVGRPARVEFDVAKGRQGKGLELQNFRVTGENIAIDGWVAMGPDNRAREYYFPEFSLNVITNLEVQGQLRPDRVWDVKATGKTFDGRDLFRSLFAIGREAPKPVRKNKPGVDFSAEFDTVLGANDATLRQVKVRAQKRAEQLTMLDFRGTLEGGQTLGAAMRPDSRQRTIVVDSLDAGQSLKLIGFYPNMVGGKGHLEVDLEGRGAVEKAGRIKIRGFKVLGDPIISELLQNADESRPAIAAGSPKRRVVREQFDFDGLDATFSVGSGQVVLENTVVHGPLIGGSMRGKLDFKSQRMQLGGTYVPLSGLNRALGILPGIREIFTGPRGEGVLGITFAIEGSMAEPQVVVNPLSLLTPGIFREIFQMTPENPKVTPRAEPVVKAQPQVRASPPTERRSGSAPGTPELIDGWSSTTKDAKGSSKR